MSTESSLTEMSEDEDVENKPPRPISAQDAYDQLGPLIQKFNAMVANITLPQELRDDWKAHTDSLMSKTVQRPYKVAIVGRTGVGKSTLLNALLHNQVLTASASGACTAVTTEISYKDVENVEAVVEFISPEDWKKTLCCLIEDVVGIPVDQVDTQEVQEENFKISQADQARKKILGVYPHLESVPPNSWNLETLMNDPSVHRYLGTTARFSAKKSSNFQKELEQFLASTLTSTDTRALWPLVKIVKIMGRFEVLSTGVTLVDLPGHGDVDNVRDNMANEYLKSADTICLVTGIARAKDDRDIHQNLHKHLSQIILDGRVKEKSILLVLTGADTPIGSNEITLSQDEQRTVDALQRDALQLGKEIQELQKRKARKENSTKGGKKKAEQLKSEITQKRSQKETKIREKNRMLAVGRSEMVTKSLQDTYKSLYCRMTESEVAPSVPIFCLGSRDFLSLAELEPDPSAIFLDKEETCIPKLRRYLEDDGERRNLADAITTVTDFCQFLSRITKFSPPNPSGKHHAAPEINRTINQIQSECGTKLQELVTDIKNDYTSLLAVVEEAIGDAERKSLTKFQEKEHFKWNKYRAMLRQDGRYDNGDLNADLTKDILPAVQNAWYRTVNTVIPLKIKEFTDDIEELLNNAVKTICSHSPHHPGSLRKSLGVESFKEQLKAIDLEVTKSAQRQGSRGWEPQMKCMLRPQYAKVSAEKGPGMYKRMKLANRQYIRDNAQELFGRLIATTKNLFSETVSNIESQNRIELARFVKTAREVALGVDFEKSELAALAEAEKIVTGFADGHEDEAITLLDNLKTRHQLITPK
ncbi:hypothetical protein B0H14DRAFT_2677325 [Mycena olivaceomarginata]|nr:hypothetical protein B0H14DRAFT_2677325 [Mycena olivaceomarginata]